MKIKKVKVNNFYSECDHPTWELKTYIGINHEPIHVKVCCFCGKTEELNKAQIEYFSRIFP